MQARTFFRIMLDNLFVNNPLCKALSSLVNFCNEQSVFYRKKLKFSKKMPLSKTDSFLDILSCEKISVKDSYHNRFIFNSGVDLK